MDYQVMEDLLKIQKTKKRGLNKEEQAIYSLEIEKVLTEEGLSLNAIHYILAVPFSGGLQGVKNWYLSLPSDIRMDSIDRLINSKEMKSTNNSRRYKIVLHLIAMIVSESNDDLDVLKYLMYKLEALSYTKDGARINDFDNAFKNNFISNLDIKAELPLLTTIGLTESYITQIVMLFNESMLNMQMKSLEDVKKIEKVKMWLHSSTEQIGNQFQLQKENNIKNKSNNVCVTPEKQSNEMNKDKMSNDFSGKNAKKLLEIAYWVDEIEASTRKNSIENTALKNKLKKSEENLKNAQERVTILEEESIVLKNKVIDLEAACNKLHSEKNDLEARISRQASVLNVYTEDKANSQNEQLNSIASALVKYFKEYEIARSMAMTTELEMTLVDLVEDIFRRLEKCGVNVKGRI